MATNEETALDVQLQDQVANSVYDILYHDVRRVGAFLSQFETYGLPNSVKAIEKTIEGQGTETLVSGGGEIPLIVKGKASLKTGASNLNEDAAERTYDPVWTNALTFLDYLESNGLIVKSIYDATIGQLVLVKGDLAIFDMEFLKAAWDNKVLSALMKQGVQENLGLNAPAKGGKYPKQPDMFSDGILPLIKQMPHAVVGNITQDYENFWFNVSHQNLALSSTDILLKHGIEIPGEWSVVAILDSYPDTVSSPALTALAGSKLGIFGTMAGHLVPFIRQAFGRPAEAYGLTPLLIFREVTNTLSESDEI